MKIKYLGVLSFIAAFIFWGVSLAQGAGSSYQFNQNLTIGSTAPDVIPLQQILINKGFLTSVSSPTGYFGTGTQAALAKFQATNGISPASGYFGPKSRALLNSSNISLQTISATQSTPSSNVTNNQVVPQPVNTTQFQTTIPPTANQSSATGTLYCVSYSSGNCIAWKYSNVAIPQINISQTQTQSGTIAPKTTASNQQMQFANYSQISFDTEAIATSTQNIENLEEQYSAALVDTQQGNIQEAQGAKTQLNQLYNAQLQAAQLTLQDAEAQEKVDQTRSISSGMESEIESEQLQNEACSSDYNLAEYEGGEGLEGQYKANLCVASAQKEATEIQNEQ